MIKDSAIDLSSFMDMLFEASGDFIVVLNEDHRIIKSNPFFIKNFPAAPAAKLNNQPFSKVIGGSSYDKVFRPSLDACLEKGKKACLSKWSEYNGTKKFLQWTFMPHVPNDTLGKSIVAVAKDFTALQNLKDEVLQKDMELKSLIQSETDCIYFLDTDMHVFDSNNVGLTFAKANSSDTFLYGDHIFSFIPQKYHEPLGKILGEVTKKNVVIKRQKYYQKSGKYYEFIFKPIRELSGKSGGVIVIAADITVEKVAEKEMHLSRNKLKSLFNSSIQSIYLLGKNYEVIEFNKKAADGIKKIWNKKLAIGDNILDYFLDAVHEQFIEFFNKALEGGKSVQEQQIDYPNGLKIWSEITFVPVYNMEGEIFGVSFSTLDITERKKVEARLSENEANLTSLIENNNALIWSVDLHYKLVLLNSRLKEFFRATFNIDPVPGTKLLDVLDKKTKKYFKRQLDKVYRGEPVRDDFEIQLPTGKVIIELIMHPIISENVIIGASVFCMDITDRKYREYELEQLNNSFRQEIEIRKKIEEDLKFKNNELDTFIYKASHDLRGLSRP